MKLPRKKEEQITLPFWPLTLIAIEINVRVFMKQLATNIFTRLGAQHIPLDNIKLASLNILYFANDNAMLVRFLCFQMHLTNYCKM